MSGSVNAVDVDAVDVDAVDVDAVDAVKLELDPRIADIADLLSRNGYLQGAKLQMVNKELYDSVNNLERHETPRLVREALKKSHESNPATMNFGQLKSECNERYAKVIETTKKELRKVGYYLENDISTFLSSRLHDLLTFIESYNYFPQELISYNRSRYCIREDLARKICQEFRMSFAKGNLSITELFDGLSSHLPSNINTVYFKQGKRGIPELEFEGWKNELTVGKDGTQNGKTNERNFFEGVWLGLHADLVRLRRGGNRSTKRKLSKRRKTKRKLSRK